MVTKGYIDIVKVHNPGVPESGGRDLEVAKRVKGQEPIEKSIVIRSNSLEIFLSYEIDVEDGSTRCSDTAVP
jgi:hypothetical protein